MTSPPNHKLRGNYLSDQEGFRRRKIRVIRSVGLRIISAPDALVYEAAELKGSYTISYVDAFLLATALREGATIVTGDPVFKKVESLCRTEWV